MVIRWAGGKDMKINHNSVDGRWNIRDFGATGDGVAADQAYIQKAIDLCSESGGGTVIVPKGEYVCGTIHLRSNVRLYLEFGSVILSSKDPELFPVIMETLNLPGQIQALIWAEGAQNVVIDGEG